MSPFSHSGDTYTHRSQQRGFWDEGAKLDPMNLRPLCNGVSNTHSQNMKMAEL